MNISGERLDVADGDVIVTGDATDFAGVDETGVEMFECNPLWETPPAVEAGRVVLAPNQLDNGQTYAYATALLSELREAVVREETTGGGSTGGGSTMLGGGTTNSSQAARQAYSSPEQSPPVPLVVLAALAVGFENEPSHQ